MSNAEEIYQHQTDYRTIVRHYLTYWPLFCVTIVLGIVVGLMANHVAQPVFRASMRLSLADNRSGGFLTTGEIADGSTQRSSRGTIEAKLGTIKSFSVVHQAVLDLGLEVIYFQKVRPISWLPLTVGPLKQSRHLYEASPIRVEISKSDKQPLDLPFQVELLSDTTCRITTEAASANIYDYVKERVVEEKTAVGALDTVLKYGETVEGSNMRFRILKRDYVFQRFTAAENFVWFSFADPQYLTIQWLESMEAAMTSETSTMAEVSLVGTNKGVICDLLNRAASISIRKDIQRRVKTAAQTVQSIDEMIARISDSLRFAEDELESFQSKNRTMNLSFQGQKLYEQVSELESEEALLHSQLKYLNYLRNYLESDNDLTGVTPPGLAGLPDTVLSEQLGQLVNLSAERERINAGLGNAVTAIRDLEARIAFLKSQILDIVDYHARSARLAVEDIAGRIEKLNTKISRMPEKERRLLSIKRKFQLNDAVFTFLQQKRAEARIAATSALPDIEVVDPARPVQARIIAPKKRLNVLLGFIVGLLIPICCIAVRDFFS